MDYCNRCKKRPSVDRKSGLCRQCHTSDKYNEWLDNTDINNLGIVKWVHELMPEFATSMTPFFHLQLFNDLLGLYNPELVNKYERLYELICFREGAKLVKDNQPTLTPNGWVKHGALKVGDYVIGSNGERTKVVRVHPKESPFLYKVITRDGRSVIVNDNHLWTIYDSRSAPRLKRRKTVTTKYIREYLSRAKIHKDPRAKEPYKDYPFFIETVKPIDFPKKSLSIDPYLLGLLIGDGNITKNVVMTIGVKDVETVKWLLSNHDNLHIKRYKGKNVFSVGVKGIRPHLKELGLYGKNSHTKFIPKNYLFSSIKDRISLLQGLVDTDGTIDKRGVKFSYTTVSKRLAKDFVELVRGLGGTATVAKQYTRFNKNSGYRLSYRISCRLMSGINPARLSRKANIWKGSIKTRSAIVKVLPIGHRQGNCITVEAKDGQYVTKDYLLTHNSTAANTFFVSYILANNGKKIKYKVGNEIKEFLLDEKTIVIISQTAGSAEEFTVRIRDTFSQNKRLRYYYNLEINEAIDTATNQWTRSAFKMNGCYVQGVGSGQQIRGKVKGAYRPTLVIADDIYSEGTVLTEESRAKTRAWWNNAVINSIDNLKGKVIMLGTILHDDTVLVDAKKNPQWLTREVPVMDIDLFHEFINNYLDVDWDKGSCILPYSNEEDRHKRMSQQRKYFNTIQNKKDWKLAWPERISLYLMAIKYQAAVYDRTVSGMYQEYFHITKAPHDKLFQRDYFMRIKEWELIYENNHTWLKVDSDKYEVADIHFGVDLSGTGSDDDVITIIATLANGKIFILHQASGKWGLRDDVKGDTAKDLRYNKVVMDRTVLNKVGIIDEIFRLAKRYHPIRIKIGVAAEEEETARLMRQVFRQNRDYTYIVSRKQTSSEGRKHERIYNSLEPYYATRMVYHAKGLDKLEYQLEFLGTSDHDDHVDSAECAFYGITYPSDIAYGEEKGVSLNSSPRDLATDIINISDEDLFWAL